MTVPGPLRRLLHILGIDRAVGFTLLNQVWAVLSRPVTLYMTVRFLTESEQGFLYTFASVLGLQMYFDLGLGVVTQQFVSHEAGHLTWSPGGVLTGDPQAKSRLASLFRLSLLWYGAVAAVLVALLLPLGWSFFSRGDDGGVSWRLAWVWTVLIVPIGVLTTPLMMVLGGCGRIGDTARFGGLQSVVVTCAQWALLAAGAALLSGPVATTVGLLMAVAWLGLAWGPAFADLWHSLGGARVSWWREVWPFQWRIAVSWPFGYLVYQLFTPVLFAYQGAEAAGRMGLSLAITAMLTNTSFAWISMRMPLFGHLIARRDWVQLDAGFRRVFLQSTALVAAGAVVVWCAAAWLQWYGFAYGNRYLPPLPMALLLASAVITHVVMAVSGYVRAHRRDPFVSSVVVMGCSMAVAMVTTGKAFGALGMAAAYLVLNALFLARTYAIFARCRREWHAEGAPAHMAAAAP